MKEKRYKLLKLYPGLPNNWEEGMEVGIGDHSNSYSPCNGNYTDFYIIPNIVENSPNYWKIVEKDYEILSFIGVQGNLATQDEKGLFGYFLPYCNKFTCDELLSHCKSTGNTKINSVKRLSDGEIFTIGDLVNYNKKSHYGNWKINNFFHSDKGILARSENNNICEYIDDLKYVKQPLFVTEDGVKIYNGCKVYYVLENFTIKNHFPVEDDRYPNIHYFSTQEAAQEYIELNKPQYSIQNIIDASNSIIIDPLTLGIGKCVVNLNDLKRL